MPDHDFDPDMEGDFDDEEDLEALEKDVEGLFDQVESLFLKAQEGNEHEFIGYMAEAIGIIKSLVAFQALSVEEGNVYLDRASGINELKLMGLVALKK